MAELTRELIEESIRQYVEPHMNKDLVSTKALKSIDIEGDKIKVGIELGFPAKGFQAQLADAVKERIESVPGVAAPSVTVSVARLATPGVR